MKTKNNDKLYRYCLALRIIPIFVLLAIPCSAQQTNTHAAYKLIERLVPGICSHFIIEYIPQEHGKDVFELESIDNKIILRGNNTVSVASALKYYLNHFCHCQITWNGINLQLPEALPKIPGKIRKTSPYKYRYYLNYTTFNYTMAWWDWERWQKEIDWMALNGINMPLALTGEAAIWQKVYRDMGFTEKDIQTFFSGPAYFAWFWMGNLDGWGGPLPQSWIDTHKALQKKILARERALGMTPVLPAFSGHVPPAFKNRFPQSKLIKTAWGYGFDSTYILDPSDPLFRKVGKKFIETQTKVYGTDHFYSADTFNENKPPSNDSSYLNNLSNKVFQSMAIADPKAIWVMQGWMFFYDASFWQPTQIQALLHAVPDDHMIILDLNTSIAPLWRRTRAYYGKPWIWNALGNGGGNLGMAGRFDSVAHNPSIAWHSPHSGRMEGIGLTMEGTEQNPAFYQLMLHNVWRYKPIDVEKWIKAYTLNRYGKTNEDASKAWRILKNTVYNGNTMGGGRTIICARPTFKKSVFIINTALPYDPSILLKGWRLLIKASDSLKHSDGFRYDLVDVTRQVLANYANKLQQQFAKAYHDHNKTNFKAYSGRFLQLISDMDKLLATRRGFLLGPWLADARSWGKSSQEKDLYEFNARDLITLWGDKDCPIHDYSSRQWSGLLNGFYRPRWTVFFDYIDSCMNEQVPANMKLIDTRVKDWEWDWVHSHKTYPVHPTGNSVKIAKEMFHKYFKIINNAYTGGE